MTEQVRIGIVGTSAVAHLAEHMMKQSITLHGEAGTLELDFPFDGPGAAALFRAPAMMKHTFSRCRFQRRSGGTLTTTGHPWPMPRITLPANRLASTNLSTPSSKTGQPPPISMTAFAPKR